MDKKSSHIPGRRAQIEAEEHALRRRRNDLDDVKVILGTPEGRRFVARVIAYGNIYTPNNSRNADVYALNGQRAMALHFLNDAEIVEPGFASEVMRQNLNDAINKYERGD